MKTKLLLKKCSNALLILLMVLTAFRAFAQNQMKTWYMDNSTIDFSTVIPILNANGDPNNYPPNVANGCYGIANNTLFTVRDNAVINQLGTTIFTLPTGNITVGNLQYVTIGFGPEMIITQVPGDCSKYYIIYDRICNIVGNNGLVQYSILMYSIVDMEANNGLGGVGAANGIALDPNNIYVNKYRGMVLSKPNGNQRYLYLGYDNKLQKYDVTTTGISFANSTTFSTLADFYTIELDISPNQTMLAMANCRYSTGNTGDPDVQLIHLDASGNVNTSLGNNGLTSISINHTKKFTGIEFSPDNSKLFVGEYLTGIKWITNLTGTPIVSSSPINNTGDYSNSQLETAFGNPPSIDYLIYAAKDPYLLGSIDPVNLSFNPTAIQSFTNPFVVHSNYSYFTGNLGNPDFYLLPDQQDGEDYDEKFSGTIAAACCFNASSFDVYSYIAKYSFNNSYTQTWTPTNNPFGGTLTNPVSVVKVRIDIIIPEGFNITMRDMTFEFLPRVTSCSGDPDDKPSVGSFGAGIKVQNGNGILAGGRLTLNNTTLTTYKECLDGMWEGVEVWGITGLAANSNQHARLIMTNNALIQNAYYGVTAGKKLNNYPNNNSNAPNNGGIITAGSSLSPNNITRFVNNMIDVYFPFNKSNVNNTSRFSYTQFITDASLSDKCYFPTAHVYMFENKGVRFGSAKFVNDISTSPYTPTELYGNVGIYAIKSSFSCAPAIQNINMTGLGGCRFENLNYGVYVKNSPYYYPVYVTNSVFTNNWRGAFLNYVYNASVNANRFDVYPYTLNNSSNSAAYGLYLDYSHGFSVEANYFTTIGLDETSNCYGIIANQTNPKRLCDQSDEIYRNVFEKIRIGIQTQGNNSEAPNQICSSAVQNDEGLVLKCNDFIEQSMGLFDIHVTNSKSIEGNIAFLQGYCNGQTNTPANNLFSHSFTNNENDFKVSATNATLINPTQIYYADYNFGTVVPANINPRRPISYTPAPCCLIPVDCNLSSQTCASKYNRPRQLIKQSVSGYRSMADSLLAIIDSSGSSLDSLTLNNLLLEHSYYTGQRNIEIDALKRYELNIAVNEESLDSVLSFLAEYNFPFETEKNESAKIYLSREDYNAAMSEVDALRQVSGFETFCDFMDLVIDIKQNNINDSIVYNDPNKVALLESIANDEQSAESAAAKDFLLKLDGKEYIEWIEPVEDSSNNRMANNSVNENNTGYNSNSIDKKESISVKSRSSTAFKVYPNPANDQVNIFVSIPKNINQANLTITDVMGRVMNTTIILNEKVQTISTESFAKGIYLLTIQSNDNSILERKELVIIK